MNWTAIPGWFGWRSAQEEAVAHFPAVRRTVAEHLRQCGSWRRTAFEDLARHLVGHARILDTALWCHETCYAVTPDDRAGEFRAAWDRAAAFLRERRIFSGEGGVMGIAAACAGWPVDYEALTAFGERVRHEGHGPRSDLGEETKPLAAGEIVVGCVTEDNPKYLEQTLRLARSLRWFGGELARARLLVGAVENIDPRVRRELASYDAEVRLVPRFHPPNGSANRLQLFALLADEPATHYLMLDCDTLIVRDPLPLLQRDIFFAKIAPFPTVTHEVFERLFTHFGLDLPERSHRTGYQGVPTIPYFNAGVFLLSREITERLVPSWRRFNAALAAEPALVAPCERHLHQAALALALAETGVPVAEAGAEINYQLNAPHLPSPPGYDEIDPAVIHYHDLVRHDGSLQETPFPRAQERLRQFNERWLAERRTPRAPAGDRLPTRVVVLGMHRSGTSLAARLLRAMGCHAGEPADLPPPSVYNPTGFWEHQSVWALDEAILAALGASWLDPLRGDPRRLKPRERLAFLERAHAIVAELDAHGTWVAKDPRLAILFPFWREVLGEPVCLLIWREPGSVARSLKHRDGLPIVQGLALWEEYNRRLLASTVGLPRVLVSYDDLVSDPAATARSIHRGLVAEGASDLWLPTSDELRVVVDPTLNRRGGGEGAPLSEPQAALLQALRDATALSWATVPPTRPETLAFLAALADAHRKDETRSLRAEAEIRELHAALADAQRTEEATNLRGAAETSELHAACRRAQEEMERERAAAALLGADCARLRGRAETAGLLLDAVFRSRSWRLGFALTRWARLFGRAAGETAVERWNKLAGPD